MCGNIQMLEFCSNRHFSQLLMSGLYQVCRISTDTVGSIYRKMGITCLPLVWVHQCYTLLLWGVW